ncbi:MAG: protein kinase [Vicinamibacterales bacterium]|nr:protein kinase [Vicinamibacterales bacterium]
MADTIGHYELLGLLGSGGYGTVYRARDTRVGRTVAVRVLGDPSSDARARASFVESVRPFIEISHPNVASLFDVGEHQEHPYLVYEFVPGERLGELAAGRPVNLRRTLDLCTQAADGLADAHSFGLAHGALTPASLVVTQKGRLKILDFGLAFWQPGGPGRLTAVRLDQRGAALGPAAIAYMAPEQILGQATDHRADIFSLGVVLYQLLTGRQPFEDSNPSDTAVKVTQVTPPAPSTVNSDVPPVMDQIVARAMSKSVADRYDSAAALASDLRAAAAAVHQREAAQDVSGIEAARAPERSLGRTFLLVSLLIAAIAVAGWTWREWFVRAWTGKLGRPLEPVVAVVPLAVASGDVLRDYVGGGVAEELARRLGQIPGMTVKGRSSIRRLGNKPAAAAAAETGADVLLTGLIGPGPDGWASFEVTVELVDGVDGRIAWSARYGGAGRDLAALQSRIARDVATRLGLAGAASASNDRSAMRIVNPEAYDIYLQGLEARAEGDTARASQLFQTAIEADPGIVEAQAALALSLYTEVVFEARGDYATVRHRMRQVAEQAGTADPDLASAHLALGVSADTYAETFIHLRRAVELDRSSASAWLAVADVVRDLDPARAVAFSTRAADNDPLLPLAFYQEAAAALQSGHRADTLAAVARGQAFAPSAPWWDALRQRAILIGPGADPVVAPARSVADFAPGALVRAVALVREGRHADAAALLGIVTRMNPGLCDARALLAGVKRLEGNRTEAARLAAEIIQGSRTVADPAPWARCAATAAAATLDAGEAAYWVGRAAGDARTLRMWHATSAVLSPLPSIRQRLFPWDGVAGDPRFGRAVTNMEAALSRVRGEAAKALEGIDRRP